MRQLVFIIIFLIIPIAYSTEPMYPKDSCLSNIEILQQRSKELATIKKTDQKERENFEHLSHEEQIALVEHDLIRRKRVAEIFAEGCFKTAKDYANAALVFQHGEVPEHYFQAFTWAKKAVEMGDGKRRGLVAAAIDRYLVSQNKKQLFGTQAFGDWKNPCLCIEPTEEAFSDDQREAYTHLTLKGWYHFYSAINEKNNCPTLECQHKLAPTPKGSIIGFW